MDEDADRDPEPLGRTEERREQLAKLNRQYKERRRELEKKAAADPWDWWPETHDDRYNPADFEIPPLWEVIQSEARNVARRMRRDDRLDKPGETIRDPIAVTIGRTSLFPHYWSPPDNADVFRFLEGDEATRVYLYYDLSPINELRVSQRLDDPDIRDALGISGSVSQSTLNRMPGSMDEERRRYYASEAETLVRRWQDTRFEDWVRPPIPDTIAPDGEGIPPVQTIIRQLRKQTYPYIRLKRDDSFEVSKDTLLRVLAVAANKSRFINDAAKNLDLKPWFDGDDVPNRRTVVEHIYKSTREEITRMFTEANDVVFELADEHDYFDGPATVAIDITDWAYYGDPESDAYVQGTKPGRNYARAWKYITLSLVGTNTPVVLMTLPVKNKSNNPYHVRRMLRFASHYLDLDRAYLDSEFYTSEVARTLEEFDMAFVIQAKRGGDIKYLLKGMAILDLDLAQMPYGVSDIDDEHAVFGIEAEKASRLRKSDPDSPIADYRAFYTNLDLDAVPPEELAEEYRERWGIETTFRDVKENFLAKSASPSSRVRSFYVNFAAHLYNLWTAANIRRAEELGEDLSDGKQFTAGRMMQAIEDDPYDLEVPDEPSESRDIFDRLFL